ncbi:N-carbamoyl-D-amino acid hydrolase [Hyella patelloides LEGE 07179]|uniref:N-carbamoyl-D-amino acid hydrolase n=1 Tax=Hyella patelloides LEGE 07179 TaxID=945734 RepID=A0A563VWN1_9CYAN|nr:carbon-nitrogen hydrolase family protein [Hyella patelloides]VEP15830.1 N-carbamoyl-D-amino acid hydrolase [Hyella patelloides LEGE 07179]
MRIGLAQMSMTSSMEDNLKKSLQIIEDSATKNIDIICFPELQLTPFFPQYKGKDVKEYELEINHDYVRKLQNACKESNLVAVPNFYLREGQYTYDASPVINSDGNILGISKMVHIVEAPCFFEQDYYTPSDSGFLVYDTHIGKIGVVICFDRHYPESIRSCALQGASLVVIPTANTNDEPLEKFEWELRIPAMQNGIFIAMCNRVEREDQMNFCGESIVVDPNGDVLAKADNTEQILTTDLNMELVNKSRKNRPYLSLRRPQLYFC